MGGPKIIDEHSRVENVPEKVPKDQPRVLQEGPFMSAQVVKYQTNIRRKSTPSGSVDAPACDGDRFKHRSGRGASKDKP